MCILRVLPENTPEKIGQERAGTEWTVVKSKIMRENINHAISRIFEMREQVAEMAGKNYGNIKAHRK